MSRLAFVSPGTSSCDQDVNATRVESGLQAGCRGSNGPVPSVGSTPAALALIGT